MMKDAKSRLPAAVRKEPQEGSESARTELDRRTAVTRERLDERAEEAKAELGEQLFDLGEQYFPAAARRRRRKVAAGAFAAGAVAGAVASHVLRR